MRLQEVIDQLRTIPLHHATEEDSSEVLQLLRLVDAVCAEGNAHGHKQRCLEELSRDLRPQGLTQKARVAFVRQAISRGVVEEAVKLIEYGYTPLAAAATNFLGDFAFNSDVGSREVLQVFDRIADRFQHLFSSTAGAGSPSLEDLLLGAAILLCVNIAATCSSGHLKLVRLVQPVCLKILQSQSVGDKLRGNTILLLANLSMTVLNELRELHVGDVLLSLVLAQNISSTEKSVAESVIIYLHGEQKSSQVDQLMARGIVDKYCVPIMLHTLRGTEFRGMFPHLLYSAKLFQVLAKCRDYAEALTSDPRVVPLLLHSVTPNGEIPRVETDYEGRRLVLEALLSFARFGLWPRPDDEISQTFVATALPQLLCDDQAGIRAAAAGIQAHLSKPRVVQMLLIGSRLEKRRLVPCGFWQDKILSWIFPCLDRRAHWKQQ
eukprot:TRINITY_DN12436_c0_g1_i1.p1 TRINITY_DN12436_c0_g1~~TRINITY_DN12436_c0_g1_i1.p1  ORF type:complete len:477 (+),score=98.63 TRINITY_DN12436_c0_g1_i1:128-1432(+)